MCGCRLVLAWAKILDFVEFVYIKLFITAAWSTMKIIVLNTSLEYRLEQPIQDVDSWQMWRPSTDVLYSVTDTSISPQNAVNPILYGVLRALARGGALVDNVPKAFPDWTSGSSFLASETLPYLEVLNLLRSLHGNESFDTYTNAAPPLRNGYYHNSSNVVWFVSSAL